MSLLSVTPSELRAKASELESLRQQHLDTMKRLRILVMSLSDSWKGKAQESFEKKFLSNNQTMTDMADALEQYITLAEEAADRAEQMDQQLLQVVNRIE